MTARRFRLIDETTGEAVLYLAQFESEAQRELAIAAVDMPRIAAATATTATNEPRLGRPSYDDVLAAIARQLAPRLRHCKSNADRARAVLKHMAASGMADIPSRDTAERYFRQNVRQNFRQKSGRAKIARHRRHDAAKNP